MFVYENEGAVLNCCLFSVIHDFQLIESGCLCYYLQMNPGPDAQNDYERHQAQVLRYLDSCFSAWCDNAPTLSLNREELTKANERCEEKERGSSYSMPITLSQILHVFFFMQIFFIVDNLSA